MHPLRNLALGRQIVGLQNGKDRHIKRINKLLVHVPQPSKKSESCITLTD